MRLVFVARDPGPSRAFKLIAEKAAAYGVTVDLLVGDGKDLEISANELVARIECVDAVLVGMSSTGEYARVELAAVFAASGTGKPVALFCDTFDCYKREVFANVRHLVDVIFVASEDEIVGAARLFLKAKAVVSGNPLWGDMISQGWSREKVRAYLGVRQSDKLIFCPGNKTKPTDEPNANVEWVAQVAAYFGEWVPDVQIVFTLHPGDQQTAAWYEETFGVWCEEALGTVVCILGKDAPATAALVPGADLIVSACSPSTDLHAALLGIPVVNVLTHTVAERLMREFGAEIPPLIEQGHARLVDIRQDSEMLSRAVSALGDGIKRAAPSIPATEDSVAIIIKALTDR